MPFIEDILKHKSLSIVGLEKNTGKTECLNYVLKRLKNYDRKVALTSIGIDGETTDQVYQTSKPEVMIYEGMMFVTTEKHYKQKQVTAEIVGISERSTSLGRLVTARAKADGKVLISGAPDTAGLKRMVAELQDFGVDLTIVDGALSRLSLASPAITDAMILATGAAVSSNIHQLVKKTKHAVELIALDEVETSIKEKLAGVEKGIWAIDDSGEAHDLQITSAYSLDNVTTDLFRYGKTIVVFGAITERLLAHLKAQKNVAEITLVARDFTRFFAASETISSFIKKGGTLKVMQKTTLVAVCINPTSPEGYVLNSEQLRTEIQRVAGVPVYDIRKI